MKFHILLQPKKGRREGSSQQEGIAEGISQKEIDIGNRKAGPEPSAQEKALAEGIAQKEIAIDTGRDESTRSWFGGRKGKASAKPQPSEVSCLLQEAQSRSQEAFITAHKA